MADTKGYVVVMSVADLAAPAFRVFFLDPKGVERHAPTTMLAPANSAVGVVSVASSGSSYLVTGQSGSFTSHAFHVTDDGTATTYTEAAFVPSTKQFKIYSHESYLPVGQEDAAVTVYPFDASGVAVNKPVWVHGSFALSDQQALYVSWTGRELLGLTRSADKTTHQFRWTRCP